MPAKDVVSGQSSAVRFYQFLHVSLYLLLLGGSFALSQYVATLRPLVISPSADRALLDMCFEVRVLLVVFQLVFVPMLLVATVGILFLPAYPESPTLKCLGTDDVAPQNWPHICIRVVTRGDYPGLIRCTINHNLRVCQQVGVENFMIEVVTNKALSLYNILGVENSGGTDRSEAGTEYPTEFQYKGVFIRELVVPKEYSTTNGTLFKARNLQFSIEDANDVLKDGDWILHFDEETALTADAMTDMVNFVREGRADLGQGMVSYVNYPCSEDPITNWFVTGADMFRVAYDLSVYQLSYGKMRRPYFGLKGSWILVKHAVERRMTWDFGLCGSISEDAYFGLRAIELGYRSGWIEGEVQEFSPRTVMDYVRQRKRWWEGLTMIVTGRHQLRVRTRIPLLLALLNNVIPVYYLLCLVLNVGIVVVVLLTALSTLGTLFSVFRTVKIRKFGLLKFVFILFVTFIASNVQCIIDFPVFLWGVKDGIFKEKHDFHLTKKKAEEFK